MLCSSCFSTKVIYVPSYNIVLCNFLTDVPVACFRNAVSAIKGMRFNLELEDVFVEPPKHNFIVCYVNKFHISYERRL